MNDLVWTFICRRGPLEPMPFTTTKVIKRRVIKQEITLQLPSHYVWYFLHLREDRTRAGPTNNRHNKNSMLWGFEGKGWSHSGETPAGKLDTRKQYLQDE